MEVTVTPTTSRNFDSLNLSAETLSSLDTMGYKAPTEVQFETIPRAQAGRDLVVQSRTGTGKTGIGVFRATTGQTPYGYLRARRVERARVLLATTDLPAAAIAAQVGFSSPSHLGRVFRALCGVTPGRYRRQLRG